MKEILLESKQKVILIKVKRNVLKQFYSNIEMYEHLENNYHIIRRRR